MRVPFFDVRDFPAGILPQMQESLLQSVARKEFILGQDVRDFEAAFAEYLGAEHVMGVGNGYDALVLSLKALGIGTGDEVILPANGYAATINAVEQVGALPVLVEPDPVTYNLRAQEVNAAITSRTKAILPIHLYGQPCFMPDLVKTAQKRSLYLVEDCAQAHGAKVQGQCVGTFGECNAFSFYPTKNLGALGDGGAVVTSDPQRAEFIRKYRNYGQSSRYVFEFVGINSRLDSLQAAVLSRRLTYLEALNTERRRLAEVYRHALAGIEHLTLPANALGVTPVYHLFVVRTPGRDALQTYLQQRGIQTHVHYPVPPHLQPAYRHLGFGPGAFPLTEALAATSLSLPLFPGMTAPEQAYVIEQVQQFFAAQH